MLVRLLGATSLQRGAERVPVGSRAVRSLLAGLASRPGAPVSVETLTGWVWGEDLPERPQAALQTVVSRLRKLLRDTGVDAPVENTPGGYRLRVAPGEVDAARFEALVRQAREAARAGDDAGAVRGFEHALGLWDAEHALTDITPSTHATTEAVRLQELRLSAVQERLDLLLRTRPAGDLLDELATLTSQHPLREAFARQYLTALDAAGRRGDALEAYRRLDRALRDELGIGPDPTTRALHADLLAERPLTPAPAPTDTTRSPVRVGTPPALAAAFQIRADLRERVCDAWTDQTAVVITQVLAGDGGVGKTQLAAALFHDALESGRADLGVWVTATSRDAVLTAYAAAHKRVAPSADLESQPPEELAERFLAWLGDTDRTWLIVLDDVADPADLDGLRPRGRSGRVLVTTRRRDAATTALGAIVDVGLFSPQESVAYLYERLSQPGVPRTRLDGAEQLAADLGHLPLALAQAAAVIIDDAITCHDYRALLSDRTLSLAEVFPRDPRASGDDYAHALPAAWSLATERATTTDPLVPAMLQLVAVLDPNGIPESVLLSPPAADHLGADPATGPRLARAALRAAHRFSLLTHTPDDPIRSVRMHALAQRAVLDQLTADELDRVIRAAADALLDAFPRQAVAAELTFVMRDNGRTLAQRHPDALRRPYSHPLLLRAGLDLGQTTHARTKVEHHAKVVARRRSTLGPEHPATLDALFQLADAREEAADIFGAIQDFEQLLASQLRVLGPEHRDTLNTRQALAFCRGEAGDAEDAATTHRELAEVAETCSRLFGPTDPLTLAVRIDTAYWQMETGDPRGAVHVLAQLLPVTERCGGADSVGAAYVRHYLARARGLAGDAPTAVAELTSLIQDRVRVTAADSPLAITLRHSRAHWSGRSGDLAGALAELETVRGAAQRVLGADHVDSFKIRAELAHWRGESGDVAGALAAYQELHSELSGLFGPRHPLSRKTRTAMETLQRCSAKPVPSGSAVVVDAGQGG